jgi:hypothetical protein
MKNWEALNKLPVNKKLHYLIKALVEEDISVFDCRDYCINTLEENRYIVADLLVEAENKEEIVCAKIFLKHINNQIRRAYYKEKANEQFELRMKYLRNKII